AGSPQGVVQSQAIKGVGKTTIATGQASPWGVHVDATNVYWSNRGTAPDFLDGRIVRATPDAAKVETITGAQKEPTGIAGDASFVYWVNSVSLEAAPSMTGELHRVAKCCPAVP